MSDHTENNRDHSGGNSQSAGFSRRTALKAGVGLGVGVAAWSGPTITSLGGTPVYAAGCTFAVDRRISGDDRNTDQSAQCSKVGGFGYHELPVFTNMPTGFTMTPSGWNSQVCSVPDANPATNGYELVLTFPKDLNCEIQVEMYRSQGDLIYVFTDITNVAAVLNQDGLTKSLVWRLPTGTDIADAIVDLSDGPNDIPGDGDDVEEPNGGGFFPSDTRYAIYLRCIGENTDPACLDDPPDRPNY